MRLCLPFLLSIAISPLVLCEDEEVESEEVASEEVASEEVASSEDADTTTTTTTSTTTTTVAPESEAKSESAASEAPKKKKKIQLQTQVRLLKDNCIDSCMTLPECASSQKQSECLNDGACLGLYIRPNKKVCYQIGMTDTCGNGEKTPLKCSDVFTSTTPMPDPCINWCNGVNDCKCSDAKSFCQENGTCHGLFDRVDLPRCYAFYGKGCGLSQPLIPVSCAVYTTTTPDPCSTTTTTLDPCSTTTTTPDPCDTTTSTTSPTPTRPTTSTTICPCESTPRPGNGSSLDKQQEDVLRWYYEQLVEFQRTAALNTTPPPQSPSAPTPTPSDAAEKRWGGMSPVFAKSSGKLDVCQSSCRGSPACAVSKGSKCENGRCNNLFINKVGKVCYKGHPKACPVEEGFAPISC